MGVDCCSSLAIYQYSLYNAAVTAYRHVPTCNGVLTDFGAHYSQKITHDFPSPLTCLTMPDHSVHLSGVGQYTVLTSPGVREVDVGPDGPMVRLLQRSPVVPEADPLSRLWSPAPAPASAAAVKYRQTGLLSSTPQTCKLN